MSLSVTPLLLAVALAAPAAAAEVVPPQAPASRPVIPPYSIRLAETILKRHPEAWSIPWKDWCYPQGFVLSGMAKLWSTTRDQRYYDYILRWAEHEVDSEGRVPRFEGKNMDDIMPGAVLAWVYQQTRDERYRKACERIRRAFDPYPRIAGGGYWHGDWAPRQFWVDGVFMGQMFLTKYGAWLADARDAEYCFGEAVRQMTAIDAACRKPGWRGLLLHGVDESRAAEWADKTTGLAPEVWSEGLGWYALILVETFDVMPAGHPGRAKLVAQYRDLAADLAATQDQRTGLWYQVVDKGDRPDNWNDTSGSAMFLYSLQRGIELGLLPPVAYAPIVERAYRGLTTKLVPDGKGLIDVVEACDGLCIQPSYKHYVEYKRVPNAKEAVAASLWATWIYEKP